MLLLVALLSACREDDAGTPQAQMRTISLNFPAIQPYTASRAENDVNAITHESTFHTADIWVFNSNNTAGDATADAYKRIEDAERYTTNTGELRTELTIPREITTVDIYVITNSSAQGLNANSTRSALQAATFNSKPDNETSPELASNGLLMSRIITGILVADLSGGYDANTQLPLERGVAKIACFFAKESGNTQAEITDITVSGATDMGSIFPEAVTYDARTSRPTEANVPEGAETVDGFSILSNNPLIVSAVLGEGQTMERGENEDAQNYVERLENTIQANHTDDYYLFEADAEEMQISIKYRIDNGEEKEAEPLVLDKDIVRNHYVVIVGTVQRTSVPVEDIELLFEIVSYENREISIPDFE